MRVEQPHMAKREAMGMIGRLIFDRTAIPAAMKSLDAGMLRTRVIADNIANATTPGYQRLEVKFEDQLRDALDRSRVRGAITNSRHLELGPKEISKVEAEVVRPIDHTLPSGMNNVDIDTEMAKLAENQIMYNYGIKLGKSRITVLNSAVQAKSIPVT
jgi:flagellar basal-body rod protein FlgB